MMAIDGLDAAMLAAAAPTIMAEWDLDKATFGIIFAASQFGVVAGAMLLGYLSDRFGRRGLVIGAVLVSGIATICAPLASHAFGLAVLRLIAALAIGGLRVTIYALVVETAPKRMRATVVGTAFVGYSAGQILCGALAGLVLPSLGWRALFFVGGGISIAAAVVAYLTIQESWRFLAGQPHRRLELIARLKEKGIDVPDDARFQLLDEGKVEPARTFMPSDLFRGRLRWLTPLFWASEILCVVVSSFYINWMPIIAKSIGASTQQAAYSLSVFAAGTMVGPLLITRLVDRLGPRSIVAATVAAAACYASVSFLTLDRSSILPFAFCFGAFALGVQMSLASLAMQFYPSTIRANATGWYMFVGGLGSVSSPVLVGHLLGAGMPSAELLVLTALPMLVLAPVAWIVAHQYRAGEIPGDGGPEHTE